MKTKQAAILSDPLKIPRPLSNPAAALIRDTIAHHGITQAEAAEAMKVSRAQLSDVIRQKKGVSANLALRVQFCLGVRAISSSDFKLSLTTKKLSTPKTESFKLKSELSLEPVRTAG